MARTKKRPGKKVADGSETSAHTITKTVNRMYKSGEVVDQSGETEEIAVVMMEGPVAHVSVSTKITRNLGDYESASVGIMVSVPCYVEEVEAAMEAASNYCSTFLDEEVTKSKEAYPANDTEAEGDEAADEDEDEPDADAEDGEDGDDEDGEIDEEYIGGLSRKELVALVEGNDELSEVDSEDFPKTKTGLKKFKAKVWETIDGLPGDGEDGDDEDGDDEDGDGKDGDDDADDADDDPYTEEELSDLNEKDLKGIWKEWELGDIPKARSSKARCKKLVEGILAAQDGADD